MRGEMQRCLTLLEDISSTDMALFARATPRNYNLRWLVVPFSFDISQRVSRKVGDLLPGDG